MEAATIKGYRASWRPSWPMFPTPEDPSRWPHLGHWGKCLRRVVRRHEGVSAPCGVCGVVSMQDTTMQGIRHYVGSVLTRELGPVAAARILGHADPSMTLRVYAHADDGDLMAAAGVLGAGLPELG